MHGVVRCVQMGCTSTCVGFPMNFYIVLLYMRLEFGVRTIGIIDFKCTIKMVFSAYMSGATLMGEWTHSCSAACNDPHLLQTSLQLCHWALLGLLVAVVCCVRLCSTGASLPVGDTSFIGCGNLTNVVHRHSTPPVLQSQPLSTWIVNK